MRDTDPTSIAASIIVTADAAKNWRDAVMLVAKKHSVPADALDLLDEVSDLHVLLVELQNMMETRMFHLFD